jgi:hypothetical protein
MASDVAFALAGLGGFNAHGAGFLQAARDNHVVPDLITVTSGQILVAAAWLRDEPDLRTGLIDFNRESDPFASIKIMLFGYPGVFRPAYAAAFTRFMTFPAFTDSFADIVANRFLPAQLYEPTRTDAFMDELVETFNEASIEGKRVGIVFNAYDPSLGTGVLYGNDQARDLMETESNLPIKPTADAHYSGAGGSEATIRPITREAVQAALWLSLYGFEGLPGGQMDGAYHRACILSELHNFSRVFVARPLANGWLGRTPRSYFDVQDWNTEMWFSVGYKAEADAMKRINQLVRKGYIKDKKFKEVELIEVEPETPAGYFNYFIERNAVYERARFRADQVFKLLAKRPNTRLEEIVA